MKRIQRLSLSASLALLLAALWVTLGWAQSEYRLNLRKEFGFSNGNQIRGTFTLDIVGDGEFRSVTYNLDGKLLAQVDSAPFSARFKTSDYAIGTHELSAVVRLADGSTRSTAPRKIEFVSADAEGEAVQKILLPILGGSGLLILVIFGVQMLFFKGAPLSQLPLGAPRNYGLLGGVICPRCQRPYPRHWWGLNLVTGKLDRCEFCGKWAMTHAASKEALAQAEADEQKSAPIELPVQEKSEEDKLRELLDQSRYNE